MAFIRAGAESPPNGVEPSSAVYRVAPSAHISAGGPASPSNCSGAMYSGVPISTPKPVSRVVASSIRATPKSATMTRSPEIRMLAGLRSRCTIPAACACASAPAICLPMSATRGQGSGPCSLISASRDRPLTNSITIHGVPSCSTTSWIVITIGMAQPRRCPRLVHRAVRHVCRQLWRMRRKPDLLDRHDPVQELIVPAPHPSQAALPDHLGQQVPAPKQKFLPTPHKRNNNDGQAERKSAGEIICLPTKKYDICFAGCG